MPAYPTAIATLISYITLSYVFLAPSSAAQTPTSFTDDDTWADTLINLASDIHQNGDILLTVVPNEVAKHVPDSLLSTLSNSTSLLQLFFTQLQQLEVQHFLVATESQEAVRQLNDDLGVSAAHVPVPPMFKGQQGADLISYGYTKTAALRVLVAAGFHVLYADVDVLFLKSPFEKLYRDSDFEAASGDGTKGYQTRGYQLNVHDWSMGWGSGGWSVHHPYLDGGLFFVQNSPDPYSIPNASYPGTTPTSNALQALRAVAAEVQRYALYDYVQKGYDVVLYSPYFSKEAFQSEFEPKFSNWGGPADQAWLRYEHQRRVWELIFNRVLTHQRAPIEYIKPDGSIAGAEWPPDGPYGPPPGRCDIDSFWRDPSGDVVEAIVASKRVVEEKVFYTSMKWSAWGFSWVDSRLCVTALHVNAHPDKLSRLLGVVGLCVNRKSQGGDVGRRLQKWVEVEATQAQRLKMEGFKQCVDAACSQLALTEEDMRQGVAREEEIQSVIEMLGTRASS